jgi:methylaspartate mutase epsilon subunit
MSFPCLRLAPHLPGINDILDHMREAALPTVAARMNEARHRGRAVVQPRCGVGSLEGMQALLSTLEAEAAPEVLTLTIDSHSRLERFARAAEVLRDDPARLNGFPLVAHGYQVVRALAAGVTAPLQVRHGSYDGRRLFAETLAAGLTSFEGGPIGYNLPYCRDIPLRQSMDAWAEIDEASAALSEAGFPVEREMFGSLTGVAVPPSIALATTFLEARLAADRGVKVISISLPQGGNMVQDIAALQCVARLAAEFLPADVTCHRVLHQFMGVFPADRPEADALIFSGGLTARYGQAEKVITKTYHEAHGVPSAEANVAGLRLTRAALTGRLCDLSLPGDDIAVEREQILAEVRDIIGPLIVMPDLPAAIEAALADGRLDIPFPANPIARGLVFPVRDSSGALRYGRFGRLPFRDETLRNMRHIGPEATRLSDAVRDAITYYATLRA